MSLATNIQAIKTILAGVAGVANVYDTVRNWQTEKQFRDSATTASSGIQFWFLTREATAAEDLGPRLTARRDRKSTRLNSSHIQKSRMPSSA